ncbi:MAG: sigma-70 family RNA polymerase sigma factor [Alphaproteobacteria bacterium]|nr:sigma-70 family RNA polymerase sigma factor [Alphaproteobacteria bacterium]MCB9694358.1 sigma-70 family RNA polymerase sigma factor [Alphaproteobacteria bacterium]
MSTVVDDKQLSREEDAAMVKAVLGGDSTAYRGLVEKYQTRVYSMVYGMVRNREDARDLTQEAFVKAFNNLKSFRLEASFYTWLYRIAMNVAIDHTRKRKRREVSGFEEDIANRDADGGIDEVHHVDNPSRSLERKQLYTKIMDSLEKLPADQKQVIILRELEGLSYKEISDVMGIPEGTVMSRLFYARKKMQKLLAGENDPG